MRSYLTRNVFETETSRSFALAAYVVLPTWRRDTQFGKGWRLGVEVDAKALQVHLLTWRFLILWRAKRHPVDAEEPTS